MKNRKPFELKNFMIGYNLFQVIACYLLIRHFFKHGWTFDYLYSCKLPDYSTNVSAVGFMYGSYFNYVIKAIELIETVMFALRKKQSQISVLHVYHHACTFSIAWIFAKYVGGKLTGLTSTKTHMLKGFVCSFFSPSQEVCWHTRSLSTRRCTCLCIPITWWRFSRNNCLSS